VTGEARIQEVAGREQKAERCNESWVQSGRCVERYVEKFINFAVKPFCFGHNIAFILSMCPKTAIFIGQLVLAFLLGTRIARS
jgi:hypothetical protein